VHVAFGVDDKLRKIKEPAMAAQTTPVY